MKVKSVEKKSTSPAQSAYLCGVDGSASVLVSSARSPRDAWSQAQETLGIIATDKRPQVVPIDEDSASELRGKADDHGVLRQSIKELVGNLNHVDDSAAEDE